VEVGGTKILVAFLEDGRQVVVYRNYVNPAPSSPSTGRGKETKQKTGPTPAMILPFPFEAGQKPVEFFALDPMETLFADLKACFPTAKQERQSLSKDKSSESKSARLQHLAVQQVGSYNVSVAESVDDLSRADPSVFQLNPEAGDLLRRHYGKGFAFVIAGLREGGEKHPLAYAHAPFEKGARLFVPTKHFHGGKDAHSEDKKPAHFEHEIYSLGAARPEAGESTEEREASLKEEVRTRQGKADVVRGKDPHVALGKLPFKVRFGPLRLLEKFGKFENNDVILVSAK
jgi:hypothetical protein